MKINSYLRLYGALALIFLFTGCASITGTKNQPISVTTTHEGSPISGATCNLVNDKGTWYVNTPGSVMIQKAYGDLSVSCKKENTHVGASIFKSSADGATFGNIIAGGLIGFAVDAGTGAGFSYSPTLNVEMIKGSAMPLPAFTTNSKNNQNINVPSDPKKGLPENIAPVTIVTQTDNRSSTLQKLEDLNEMLKKGLINQKDFDVKKSELLKSM
jgi:hypothetical protein